LKESFQRPVGPPWTRTTRGARVPAASPEGAVLDDLGCDQGNVLPGRVERRDGFGPTAGITAGFTVGRDQPDLGSHRGRLAHESENASGREDEISRAHRHGCARRGLAVQGNVIEEGGEAGLRFDEQRAVGPPDVGHDLAVEGSAGQVPRRRAADGLHEQVVRRGSARGRRYVGEPLAVRRDPQIAEGSFRGGEGPDGAVGHGDGAEAIGPLVRSWSVGGGDVEAIARRRPLRFVDLPGPRGHLARFAGDGVGHPETGALVILVHYTGIVLVLLPLLLGLGLCLLGEEGQTLAVGRPLEPLDARLLLGEGHGFAAVDRHDVDLRLLLAIGEEGQALAVGGPARRAIDLGGSGEPPGLPGLQVKDPDVRIPRIPLRRLRDRERQPVAIGREAQVRDPPPIENPLGRELGLGGDTQCRKQEQAGQGTAWEGHRGSFSGSGLARGIVSLSEVRLQSRGYKNRSAFGNRRRQLASLWVPLGSDRHIRRSES
jgi:hypothetical protein